MDQGSARKIVELLPRLRRFALSLCGSTAEADDLVQSACERALATRAVPRAGSRLDSWMFRIIQNQWIDSRRAVAGRGPHLCLADVDEGDLASDAWPAIEARFALAQVRRAISGLPRAQRTVLELACLQGLSYRECAHRLNLPEGTVMSRLARARDTLSRRLAVTV